MQEGMRRYENFNYVASAYREWLVCSVLVRCISEIQLTLHQSVKLTTFVSRISGQQVRWNNYAYTRIILLYFYDMSIYK